MGTVIAIGTKDYLSGEAASLVTYFKLQARTRVVKLVVVGLARASCAAIEEN